MASIKERLRLCKKKEVQLEGSIKVQLSSPAGGIDKKAAGKVNNSPRKATKPRIKPVIMQEEDEDSVEKHDSLVVEV